MLGGHQLIVCDDLSTGDLSNIAQWMENTRFKFISYNIARPLELDFALHQIYHLASPASPTRYMQNPVATIKTNTFGTINMLELARKTGARVLIASSSEVYGDPRVHPQTEDYWGNVNPFGPRSCYDEGKRISESLAYAYQSQFGVSVRVARIFNTYGPRMSHNDGRVVSNFISQALNNRSMTVHGSGSQTRSFQYVSDLIDGLMRLMNSPNVTSPVNLGAENETSIIELANAIRTLIPFSNSSFVFAKARQDDPQQRRANSSKALKQLDWTPRVGLVEGLAKTIDYAIQQYLAI